MVKIEEYESSATPMQMLSMPKIRTQSSRMQNLQAKCVKCASDHSTRECTKDLISPATCSNCNGSHPANYRQCPKYIAYARPFSSPTQTPPALPQDPNSFPRLWSTRGNIANFRCQQTPQEISTNTMSDFKDIISLIKSFNNKNYIAKLK